MARNNKLYWPTCTVCQYMKRNRDFAVALILSSYFNPKGQESLPEVNKRFGEPFTLITLYKHTQRHMKLNAPRWIKLFGLEEKKNWAVALEKTHQFRKAQELVDGTMAVIETPTAGMAPHETALDKFIAKGDEMVDNGQINITATTYIQAIKAKAEIETKNKDRRLEALKNMFVGAAPKDD